MAKLKRFSDWAGLSVNLTKCAHTALVAGAQGHAAQPPLPFDVDIAATTRANLTIPWLPPDETYRYLGVELNAALDWKADATDSATTAEAKALCIEESAASLRQKMMLLGGNVVMSTSYRFAAGGATPSAAARLRVSYWNPSGTTTNLDALRAAWSTSTSAGPGRSGRPVAPAFRRLTGAPSRLPTSCAPLATSAYTWSVWNSRRAQVGSCASWLRKTSYVPRTMGYVAALGPDGTGRCTHFGTRGATRWRTSRST